MKDVDSRLSRALGDLLGCADRPVAELEPAQRAQVVKWLYDILSILDAKSSHGLRTSAISLAAQTFLVGLILNNRIAFPDLFGADHALLVGSLLVPLLASTVALKVFQVKWRFLEFDLHREIDELSKVVDARTDSHQIAWRLSMAAAATLALIVLLATGAEVAAALRGDVPNPSG